MPPHQRTREEVARTLRPRVNTEMRRHTNEPRDREAVVVEDDPDARRVLAGCLRRLGLTVHEATGAAAAIDLLERVTPDVLCVDVRLPDGSGFAICEHVRTTARLRDVPVLVISALTRPIDRAQAQAAGADEYVTKPFRAAALTESVRELLALSAVSAS